MSGHSILAIKKRVEQDITVRLAAGMDMDDLLSGIVLDKTLCRIYGLKGTRGEII